jgi:hypothetical protein
MEITFERLRADEGARFASFLASQSWPFHSQGTVDAEAIAREVADGRYDSASVRTHWILVDGERARGSPSQASLSGLSHR